MPSRIEIKAAAPESLRTIEIEADEAVTWSDVQAASTGDDAKSLKGFTMLAYSGGRLSVGQFPQPVIVDLQGMRVRKGKTPAFLHHDKKEIVGHGTPTISENRITMEGVVSGAGKAAQEVRESAANGFPWQASIGAQVQRLQQVHQGETATVNGKTVRGPVLIARKSVLNEISFVPIGADRSTSATVAATVDPETEKDDTEMEFHDWLKAQGWTEDEISAMSDSQTKVLEAAWKTATKAPPTTQPNSPANRTVPTTPANPQPPIQASGGNTAQTLQTGQPMDIVAQMRADASAELERQSAIRRITASYGDVEITVGNQQVSLEAHAIKEGWNADKTELEAHRAHRPTAPGVIVRDRDVSDNVLEAAVCTAGGLENVEAHYNEQTLDAAHRQFRHGIGLQELLLEAAWRSGYQGRSFRSDHRGILEAAFSTTALTGILSNIANKFLLAGFMAVEDTWMKIAATRNVSDFKTVTSYRMSGAFDFLEVGPTGELKHDTVDEESFTNQARTYGRMFGISRQQQINDDLDALSAIPRRIGRGGALKLNDVFWTTFLSNSTFFKTANKNYFDGASSNLSSASLKTAQEKFRKQTDPDGKPLAITPRILLVPPEEEVAADELMTSTQVNTGGSSTKDKVPNRNVWSGKYERAVSTYLSNESYSGYSALAWYLLASPQDLPVIEVAFLNGVKRPTVESADADFNVLGIQMRGFFDFGVSLQDHRGGVKSKGES